MSLDLKRVREHFPALTRDIDGVPAAYLDGPAGSQVPRQVIDSMAAYLGRSNANTHGAFVTSRETDALIAATRVAVADFLGADDPNLVVFGPNMTTLTFALSRAMARAWRPGDEIIVTRLDHDANVTPWVMAARDAGATVRKVAIRADATLDMDDLVAALSPRTRLVAVTAASNATGSLTPVAEICRMAHAVGAEVFVDAVHHAPHKLVDVAAWGCDYLACSAYKFFGPHLGVLWGKRERMSALPAYQVRPAGDDMPERWCTGTQSHEAIAGTLAAIGYLEELGREQAGPVARRQALVAAYQAIEAHERELLARLLRGLAEIPGITVHGICELDRLSERVPTVSFSHARLPPFAIASALGKRGVFVWHGNFYAVEVVEALGLGARGMVRVGILHYNTADEIERLLAALGEIVAA